MRLGTLVCVLSYCGCAFAQDTSLRTHLSLSSTPAEPGVSAGCTEAAAGRAPVSQPIPGATNATLIETPQLKLSYSASDATFVPGGRITLILDFEPKPRVRVYAPGAGPYSPVEWDLKESSIWASGPVTFPPSHLFSSPDTKKLVPVFEGRVRLVRGITISPALAAARSQTPCLSVEGSFRYQACDDKECYLPKILPLTWVFKNRELKNN